MSRGLEVACWAFLAKDAEQKQSKAGNNYTVLVCRTDSGQVDAEGKATSVFLKCMAFGNLAAAAVGLKKNSRVYIEGSLSVSIWQPSDGSPARPDLSCKLFTLTPTKIGQSRPRAEGQKLGESFDKPLDRMKPAHQQAEFADEIPF